MVKTLFLKVTFFALVLTLTDIALHFNSKIPNRGLAALAEYSEHLHAFKLVNLKTSIEDKEEDFLYISETSGKRILRMPVNLDGTFDGKNKEIFGPNNLGPACFPDDIAFDSIGTLWRTLV